MQIRNHTFDFLLGFALLLTSSNLLMLKAPRWMPMSVNGHAMIYDARFDCPRCGDDQNWFVAHRELKCDECAERWTLRRVALPEPQ